VAKTANNSRGKQGKGRPSGKPAQGRSVARRDGKPARGKAQQRPAQKARGKQPAERQGGFMKFLRDVRVELSKVTWPTRKDLIQSTIVVLVAVAIATAYTGALDFVFSKIVDTIVKVLT
jgi:preprotein translocase subunit SecE